MNLSRAADTAGSRTVEPLTRKTRRKRKRTPSDRRREGKRAIRRYLDASAQHDQALQDRTDAWHAGGRDEFLAHSQDRTIHDRHSQFRARLDDFVASVRDLPELAEMSDEEFEELLDAVQTMPRLELILKPLGFRGRTWSAAS